MWTQPQVGENFLNDLALVNEGDDAHRGPTPDTHQGIDLIHFLDQLRPARLKEVIVRTVKYKTWPSPPPARSRDPLIIDPRKTLHGANRLAF